MNKKGFTLIEILGVVVIIGLLLLVIAPPLISSISNKEADVDKVQCQLASHAADLYLDSHNETSPITDISISDLQSAGYLAADFDSQTKKQLTGVHINYDNGVRSFSCY